MVLPQTSSASIISPTAIIFDDGRLNGSISAADTCPDFSSANIVLDNSYDCALQKNSMDHILSFLNELNVITEQLLNSLFSKMLVLQSYFFGYQSH